MPQIMNRPSKPKTYREFDTVELARPVVCEGHHFPKGSIGTIVHVSSDPIDYEIEFFEPHACVATVVTADLA